MNGCTTPTATYDTVLVLAGLHFESRQKPPKAHTQTAAWKALIFSRVHFGTESAPVFVLTRRTIISSRDYPSDGALSLMR
jgi:hypothetical protein